PEIFADRPRVGADQHLVRIEPVSARRIARAVYPKRVKRTRLTASNEDMPEMKRLVPKRIEPDRPEGFCRPRRIEEQQGHLRRGLGKKREVHSRFGRGHTGRMRKPRLDGQSGHTTRY